MSDGARVPKRRGRPPSGRGRLKLQLQVRATDEWGTWVEELAKTMEMSTADLVAALLKAHARRLKFRKPPPRT